MSTGAGTGPKISALVAGAILKGLRPGAERPYSKLDEEFTVPVSSQAGALSRGYELSALGARL